MTIQDILCIFEGVLALIGGSIVIRSRKILHALIGLIMSMLSVSALYFSMGALLLGTVQIMVYAGGVIVLMLFGILYTPLQGSEEPFSMSKISKLLVPFFLLVILSLFNAWDQFDTKVSLEDVPPSNINQFSKVLLTKYILLFEGMGLLLFGILVGVLFLLKNKKTL